MEMLEKIAQWAVGFMGKGAQGKEKESLKPKRLFIASNFTNYKLYQISLTAKGNLNFFVITITFYMTPFSPQTKL